MDIANILVTTLCQTYFLKKLDINMSAKLQRKAIILTIPIEKIKTTC